VLEGGETMRIRHFWIAALLSAVVHSVALAASAVVFHWTFFLPPSLLEAYGDSDREGFSVDAVIMEDAGTLRQGDVHTPGGDGLPLVSKSEPIPNPTPQPPVLPPTALEPMPKREEPPPPPKPVEPPPPERPLSKPEEPPPPKTPEPVPPEKPLPKPELPPPAARSPSDKPADSPPPSPKPVPREARPAESTPAAPQLPGATGGSHLPLGTPSLGGIVGTRTGVRMGSGVKPPQYPAEAREAGLEGMPVIWLKISAEGEVLEAKVHKSCGHNILDKAALDWAKAQKYIPARQGDTAIEAEVTKPVSFKLY